MTPGYSFQCTLTVRVHNFNTYCYNHCKTNRRAQIINGYNVQTIIFRSLVHTAQYPTFPEPKGQEDSSSCRSNADPYTNTN